MKIHHAFFCLVLATALAAAAPAAEAFKAAAPAVPAGAKALKKFKDRAEADKFVELLGVKQATLTQIEVLQSLVREKQEELRRFNARLSKQFGIDAEGNYEFNAENGAIMQVTILTNAPKGRTTTNEVEKKLVRRLDKKEDRGDFVRMAAARNVTREEIAAFTMVVAEKNLELQQCDKRLLAEYGISNKSAYQYVAGDMTVYELPGGGSQTATPEDGRPVPK